jgi:hypothetical protein
VTVTVAVDLADPPAFEAVRVTVYVPAALYVWAGFCAVDGADPSPKSHDHDVGEPVEVSWKATLNGAVPDVGDAVNDATGAAGTLAATLLTIRSSIYVSSIWPTCSAPFITLVTDVAAVFTVELE